MNSKDDKKMNKLLLEKLAIWYDSPLKFVRECIGVEPSDQQIEGLNLIAKSKRVTIRSGHGPGKDAFAAWCIIWFMSTRLYPKIPCTAPTARQLSTILWAEVSKWLRQSKVRDQFEIQKDKIYMKGAKEEWFAVAITASVKASADDQAEALAGFHAEHILVVVDEASGVADPVYIPLEGIMTQEDNRALLIGNPTKSSGYFYETHKDDKISGLWDKLVWNSEDSSNVAKSYCERMERKYGRDSNVYRVRVLGEFPVRDGDSFIPYDLANDAVHRDIESQEGKLVSLAVDVARFGSDDTVISVRRGEEFLPFHILRQKDTMEVVKYICDLSNKEKPVQISIDVIGIGAGVYDRLKEMGYPAFPVNVAESPSTHPARYRRLRDELWGKGRDWLESRVGKMWDNPEGELVAQLSAVKYDIIENGKIKIESKKDMKKRKVSSPDIADAFLMQFASPLMQYNKELEDLDYYLAYEDSYAPLDNELGF